MPESPTAGADVDARLGAWLQQALQDDGPFSLQPLSGGNSNETLLLSSPTSRRVLRRPPAAAISASAHSMEREHRMLEALARAAVPAPAPLALCTDPAVPGAPFLIMEVVDGVAITDTLPPSYPNGPASVRTIGARVIDALAAIHNVGWHKVGLDGFGRPDKFVARQVPRWSAQLEQYRTRDLPHYDSIGAWLAGNAPPDGEPAILHGDFHLDNCLLTPDASPIEVLAVIDWEMATIGDPLLDLGLFLAFWGHERPTCPAMPHMQAISRIAGAPTRNELAERYAERTGRSIEHLRWYMTLAFWKLASIVEAAYAQFRDGRLRTPYAEALGTDVPRLLEEAASFAGLRWTSPEVNS